MHYNNLFIYGVTYMPKAMFNLRLVESRMISHRVRHFAFSHVDNHAFDFTPGQFISIHFNDKYGMQAKRSYSIASIHGQSKLIEFAASEVGGPGTEFLFNLPLGSIVQASGPLGRLVLLEPNPKRYILIGTSTGITPYRSMLTKISENIQQDKEHHTVIIQGVQNREQLLYHEDFIKLHHQYENYEFRAHYSRQPEDTKLEDFEHHGYAQSALPALELDDSKDYIYLCGSPHMIEDTCNYLKSINFDSNHIKREKYYSKSN